MLYETLTQYCSIYLKQVDRDRFRMHLESSPSYPSLLAVVTACKAIGLNILAGQCDWSYLQNIQYPFILHLRIRNQERLFIAKWDKENETLMIRNFHKDRWEAKCKSEIEPVWTKTVLYTDQTPISQLFIKKDNIALIVTVAVICFVISILCYLYGMSLLCILPILIGLITSFVIKRQANIFKIDIIDRLCHLSTATDCNIVENSKYAKIGQMSMSNLALSFFLSQAAICLRFSIVEGIEKVLYSIYSLSALMIIPIIAYSTYSQVSVKKVCPLCVLIQLCILVQSIIFIIIPSQPIGWNVIIDWVIYEIMLLCLLLLFSKFRANKEELIRKTTLLLKLKRKKNVISAESSIFETIDSCIYLGSDTSDVIITTIISPSCKHCRQIVTELIKLLDMGLMFKWNIIFGETDKHDTVRIRTWIGLYLIDKERFINSLRRWVNEDYRFSILTLNVNIYNNTINKIVNQSYQQLKQWNIMRFPQIILNDRLLSSSYAVEDLEFMITDLSI